MRGLCGSSIPSLWPAAAPVEPGDRALDDPALWHDGEALRHIGAFDDLYVNLTHAIRSQHFWMRSNVSDRTFASIILAQ